MRLRIRSEIHTQSRKQNPSITAYKSVKILYNLKHTDIHMCLCVYVYIGVCACVRMHIVINVYAFTHARTCTCVSLYVSLRNPMMIFEMASI